MASSIFTSEQLTKGNFLDLEGAKAFIKEYGDWLCDGGAWSDAQKALVKSTDFAEFIEEAYTHNVHFSAMALRDFIDKVWEEDYGGGFYWTPSGCEWLTHYKTQHIQKMCKDGDIDAFHMASYHISLVGVMQLIERREKFFKEHPERMDEYWLWN